MSEMDVDYLIDRRRLRRKLTFWRVTAVLVAAILLIAIGWRSFGGTRFEHQIARIDISGLVTGDRATLKLIDTLTKASNVDAVEVSIQSPGGTTAGSQEIYDALRRLSARKPTVAVVRTLAASGAYICALGTDRIVAQSTSLVGSIGVLFQFPNVTKLLDTVGVQVEEVKSSPLKAAPNGYTPTSPEARAALASLVADSYAWFKDLVKTRRHMSDPELAAVSDGRVFTGHQALPLKLVDQLGEERDAIAWLEWQKGVGKDLPIVDWKPAGGSTFGLFSASARVADLFGLRDLADIIRRANAARTTSNLDGLLALWQGQSGN